jgi:hypothetical protein
MKTISPDLADTNIAYVNSAEGHRLGYSKFLGKIFGLKPCCEPLSAKLFFALIKAEKLLFATFDDTPIFGFAVATARMALGKKTAALILRPNACFTNVGASWKSRLKTMLRRHLFICLNNLPKVTLVSLIQPEIDGRISQIAGKFAIDPEFWDMHDGTKLREPASSSLAEEIEFAAVGRKVISISGTLTTLKGFGFLAEILAKHPEIKDEILVVATGKTMQDSEEVGQKFVANGGMLVDRYLDDTEIESIYRVSDLVWSCYAPSYNFSSGIFGRAVQFCVPAILRKTSYLEKFADMTGIRRGNFKYPEFFQ